MAANAAFAKMNGLGNEIIVADMRGRTDVVTPAAAIALARDAATRFDQIMAIHDPRTPGTANYIQIINSDGSFAQACGNGMRCVVQTLAAEAGQRLFVFETVAGILNAEQHEDGLISVDMGAPRFDWRDIPLAEPFRDTTQDRTSGRAHRRPGAALSLRCLDGQSARHLLGRPRCLVLRTGPLRPAAGKSSDLSRARQHHHRAGDRAGQHDRSAPGNAARG